MGYRRKQLGSSAGGEKLGCSLYEVPPGRRAWPYHYHLANEEAIYVLEGSGTLRIGREEIGVSKGDYVALPARAQAAHQLVNDSGVVLRCLCYSTMIEPDVMVYPDSGRWASLAGLRPEDRRRREPSASSSERRPRSATTRAKNSGALAIRIPVSEGYK